MKSSPKYRIPYFANGWDELSDKQIRKKKAKLQAKFGDAVAEDFEKQMLRLRGFGDAIDSAFSFISPMYLQWGRLKPESDIYVVVESEPFDVPGHNLDTVKVITGTVLPDKRTIRVVYWWRHENGTLQNACDLVVYETGNLHFWRLIGNFDGVHEIGDGNPNQAEWIKK